MEVGLSAIHSIKSQRGVEAKEAKSKFSDALAEIQSSTPKKDIPEEQEQVDFSKLLEKIAAYLKGEDLKEVETDGELILHEVLEEVLLSDQEGLLKKVLEQLGLDSSQLNAFIQKWSNDETVPGGKDLMEVLSGLLEKMAELPKKELINKLDDNDMKILKSLKLHELLMKHSAPAEDVSNENEKLKAIGDKLIAQASPEKLATDYIQMRFTRLAAELNQKSADSPNLLQTIAQADPAIGQKNESNALSFGFLHQATKLEQLGLMMGSQEKPVSAEQLIKQFESILAKSTFLNSGGSQKLFIKLFPEHLGSIRVELFQKDQSLVAKIIASSGTAKEALESQVGALKQAFAGQNITVERIEILQQASAQERFFNKDPQQQQRERDRQEQDHGEDKGDFSLVFEEAQLNAEA